MARNRQKVIQSAEKLVARGRLQAAIDEYRKVLELSPNDTSTLNRVGDLYVQLNRLPKAVELFRKTAESFSRQGFFVKAIAIYKKIIRLDPSQIKAYESLAGLYHRQGLASDAQAQYQVVADYYVKHGDLDSALGVHRSMIEVEPTNPSHRLQLADLLEQADRLKEALDQYFEIANLMLSHQRIEEAARVFESAVAVDPENLSFLERAASALREAGAEDEAERLVEIAAERNPEARRFSRRPPSDWDEAPSPTPSNALVPAESLLPDDEKEPGALEVGSMEEEEEAGEEVDYVLDLDDTDAADLALSTIETMLEEGEEEAVASGEPEVAASEDEEVTLGEVGFEVDREPQRLTEETKTAPTSPGGTAKAAEETATEPAAPALSEASAGVPLPPESLDGRQRLWIEADVLARYDMPAAAVECLQQLLEIDPDHLDALERLAGLQLDLGRMEEVVDSANRLAESAASLDHPEVWESLRERLLEAGFRSEGARLVPPLDIEDEAAVAPEAPAEPREAVAEGPADLELDLDAPDLDAALAEDLIAEVEAAQEAAPVMSEADADGAKTAAVSEAEAEEEEEVELASVSEAEMEEGKVTAPPELEAEEESERAAVASETEEEPREGGIRGVGDLLEEEGAPPASRDPEDRSLRRDLEWLEEVVAREGGAGEADREFFDLATELEEELREEGALGEELLPPLETQSLEEIVEAFRKCMEETLSPEDYDTHYSLGIAYREMGLLDEAIGEFQLASKDPRYLVDCCSLLANCFLDKGFPELAVKWYQEGLELPRLEEEQRLGLLYELGSLEASMGDAEAARERFVEIYGINSNYHDIVARLEELGSRPES